MDIKEITDKLVSNLYENGKSLQKIEKKGESLRVFSQNLTNDLERRNIFKSNSMVDAVFLAVTRFANDTGAKKKIPQSIGQNLYLFFSDFASMQIFPSSETSLINIRQAVLHSASVLIPSSDMLQLTFWLSYFSGFIKVSWFWNLFEKRDDQDSLFSILSNLTFKFYGQEDDDLIKDSLNFLNAFLEDCPYQIPSEHISNFFEQLPNLVKRNTFFIQSVLNAFVKLIPKAPVLLSLNTDIFSPPFPQFIIEAILKEWPQLQKNHTIWQVTRAYLLYFITYTEVMDFTIPEQIILGFYNRIKDVWSSTVRRAHNLDRRTCVQYLRFDVEIFKRIPSDNFEELSKLLFTVLVEQKMSNSTTSDFMFLITAIAKYAPKLISQKFWYDILDSLVLTEITNSTILNVERMLTPFIFLKECLKIIDNMKLWDKIFLNSINLMKKIPNDMQNAFFSFINQIIKNQRISTNIAHEYQHLIWDVSALPIEAFCKERQKCIILMIYYYGFESAEARQDCFQTMITVLEKAQKAPSKSFIKYTTMILCSVVQSHACPVKLSEDINTDFENQCKQLADHMRFGVFVPKKEYDNEKLNSTQAPIKSQFMYKPSADNSQIMTGDQPVLFSQSMSSRRPEKKQNKQPDNISLCNFINKNFMASLVATLKAVQMTDILDTLLFKLYKCIYAPKIFPESQFLKELADEFNKATDEYMEGNFIYYILLLNSVAKVIDGEAFEPFFEKIEHRFFELMNNYIQSSQSELQSYYSSKQHQTWKTLNDIHNSLVYTGLQDLSLFCSRCANLVPHAIDDFMRGIVQLYDITKQFPLLHLDFVSELLPLAMSQEHIDSTLMTINEALETTLFTYSVPITEREDYISHLFKSIQEILINSETMNSIFTTISRYEYTPQMKLSILKLARDYFTTVPSLFLILWNYNDDGDDSDPFFIMSSEQVVRIKAIETVISVLSSSNIEGDEQNKLDTFETFINPSIEGNMDDSEKFREECYTSLGLLSNICAKIPELTTKILVIILKFFAEKKPDFSNRSISLLFKPFSERTHYSSFLRDFLPLIIKNYIKNMDDFKLLEDLPLDLFFDPETFVSKNEKMRQIFKTIAPYLVLIGVKSDSPGLLEFTSRVLEISIQQLIDDTDPYLLPYLLACSKNLDEPIEIQQQCLDKFNQRIKRSRIYIDSPIYILDLIPLFSSSEPQGCEEPLMQSYEILLHKNQSSSFEDFHRTLLLLYQRVYNSNHPIIQSIELRKYFLYCQILLRIHKSELNKCTWLYVDMFVLTTNMLSFAPPNLIEKTLNMIAREMPDSLQNNFQGLKFIVRSFEDICNKCCPCEEAKEDFKERFEDLIDTFQTKIDGLLDSMLLVYPFRGEQIKSRDFGPEFRRIACTGRVNKLGIDFMVQKMYEHNQIHNKEKLLYRGRKNNLLKMFSSVNEERREGMLAIYNFIQKEHYPPAVLVYTELFAQLYDIIPSPMIISGDIDFHSLYLDSLNSYVRDTDPKICIAALEAIRHSKDQSGIHSQLDNANMSQISEYTHFQPQKSEPVIPDTKNNKNIPWVSKSVVNMIKALGPTIVYYPCMELASLCPEFAKKIYPQVFLSASRKESILSSVLSEFDTFHKNPAQYTEENLIILKTYVVLKNHAYIWNTPKQKDQKEFWYINWMNLKPRFAELSQLAFALGDPYLAYQFAEFSRETSDDLLSDDYIKQVFSKLGVVELMYDLNINIMNLPSIASIHEQEKRLSRSLLLYDQFDFKNPYIHTILRNLHLDHLQLSQGPNTEALWRLQKWEIPSASLREMDITDHHTQVFRIMQSFASTNEISIQNFIEDYFKNFKLDKTNSINEQFSLLLDSCTLLWFQTLVSNDNDNNDLNNILYQNKHTTYWTFLQRLVEISKSYFEISESSSMLNAIFLANKGFLGPEEAFTKLPKVGFQFISDIIKTCADIREVESAQYFVQLLRSSMEISQPANFQQLYVLNVDSPIRSVALLQKNLRSLYIDPNMVFSFRNSDMTKERANIFNLNCSLTYAQWCAQTHYLHTQEIYSQLQDVIQKAEENQEVDVMAEAYLSLAKFEHNIHKESSHFFHSQEYESLKSLISNLERNGKALSQSAKQPTRDLQQIFQDLQMHTYHMKQEKEKFSSSLITALEMYMKVLQVTDKYNLEALYNFINLWFNYSFNDSKEFLKEMPEIIDTMQGEFLEINPGKFLPLFYQLAARVDYYKEGETPCSEYTARFQQFLQYIVRKVCYADPCTCFPVLFALTKTKNLDRVGELTGKVFYQESKIKAVEELIQTLCYEDSVLEDKKEGMAIGTYKMDMHERWNQMSSLLNEYVDLALSPFKGETGMLKTIAPNLLGFTGRQYMHVITNSKHPVIKSFNDKIRRLDGNSRPIMLEITGVNGKKYRQILKGDKDDLRQDAVMQQLFSLSSQLLSMHNHNLRIRCYKVIPLTPTSGLIEMVEKSTAIGEYLRTAHDLYKTASSISFKEAFGKFKAESDAYHTLREGKHLSLIMKKGGAQRRAEEIQRAREKLIAGYEQILQQFPPVFRFFFVEKFHNTGDWFKARINYCRHTAANSMVGFIFGIGDRHCNNILIDTTTGEVIHIDLGIAFEQGKMLRISELVPFRMTPDIVDGFGHVGGMGLFRRSCEETLKLLRTNREYLTTVLDVFMRDPLYTWSVVPKTKKMHEELGRKFIPNQTEIIQNQTKEGPVKTAESVILRCQMKLEGNDTGEVLSVEGQVAQLISEATDHSLLSMMFCGWKPYL